MIALITTSLPQLEAFRELTPDVGRLFVPGLKAAVERTVEARIPWAADCGGFKGVDARAYLGMLSKLPADSGCLFVVPPDRWSDATESRRLFDIWRPIIAESLGLPIAFVLQDGLTTPADVPWDRCDAVFIGGSNHFRKGGLIGRVVAEAHARGKWAHMGRVSSPERAYYARSLGCDSFDGSQWGRFPDLYLPKLLAILENHPLAKGGMEAML